MKRYSITVKFIGLAFLIYFSIYSSSPLIYTVDKSRMPSLNPAGSPVSYCKGLHIYLYELICSNFLDKSGSDATAKSGIFILKKRAVLSEVDPQKLLKVEVASVDGLSNLEKQGVFATRVSPVFSDILSDNFERVSSGLSPPSV